MEAAGGSPDVPPGGEEEAHRAAVYRLLAALLAAPPDSATLAMLRETAGGSGPFAETVGALGRTARETTPAAAEAEFQALFIGLGQGELVPYASYYMTGFLHEKPLARLRADLRALGIARAEGVAEPEDGMAFLCEAMAGLIDGSFGAPASIEAQQRFFDTHLAPWAGRFFADLEAAPSSVFYRPVGRLGRLFAEIESDAFRIAA